MPNLRDHVRSALSRTEPTPAEAKGELDAILARSRRPRRTYVVAGGGFALAAAVLFVVLTRGKDVPAPIPPPAPPQKTAGVHLYLRVAGEPVERALTMDLTSQGEL